MDMFIKLNVVNYFHFYTILSILVKFQISILNLLFFSTGLVEVKQEFGTDSYVQALKLKRKSQNDAFNNFNWRRWLRRYSWLERDTPDGTVGFCKYCLMHLNVEFSYLRDRHQESAKHKDAEKQHEELCKRSKQSKLSDGKISETNGEDSQSKK